jgi:hypothetical protein
MHIWAIKFIYVNSLKLGLGVYTHVSSKSIWLDNGYNVQFVFAKKMVRKIQIFDNKWTDIEWWKQMTKLTKNKFCWKVLEKIETKLNSQLWIQIGSSSI